MKKTNENSTVSYEPVQVCDNVAIRFTKSVSGGNLNLYGKIMKGETEVGTVTYDSRNNVLITSVKPFDALDKAELAAVYAAIPECINEMLEE